MRVLLSTIGSRGDVQPLVALATQLRAIGHDATFCVPPDFVEWLRGLGFEATPIGPELRSVTARPVPSPAPATPPAPMSLERRRQLAEATVAAQFQTVDEAARGCDAIVAATALQIAARSVAERLNVRYAFAAYCPAVLPSPHHAPPPLPPLPGVVPPAPDASNLERWKQDGDRFNTLFGPALNAHRTTLGLSPVDDVRAHVLGSQPWLAVDRALAPWPGSDGEVFQPGAWILPDTRPLGREIEGFLDAGEPPIYFGFGSMRAPVADVTTMMVQAARAVGRRAIISRGWADLAVDTATDCLVIDETNQQALFARVAAVVHHGGAGTTTAAARAGAPQVIVPQLYDQHYWAQRVAMLGIGVAHAPGEPTAESLMAVLDAVLQSGLASKAAALAPQIGVDGARVAAERLSQW